jgi:hypothetical protein
MTQTHEVQFYSTKKLWKRRQYHWRTIHINGHEIERSSEGYNNRSDRDEAFYRLRAAFRDERYTIKDLDKE